MGKIRSFHVPDDNTPNPHKLVSEMVETRVGDCDIPEHKVMMPYYKCINCGWTGFAPQLFGCDNPDISELTDILNDLNK